MSYLHSESTMELWCRKEKGVLPAQAKEGKEQSCQSPTSDLCHHADTALVPFSRISFSFENGKRRLEKRPSETPRTVSSQITHVFTKEPQRVRTSFRETL